MSILLFAGTTEGREIASYLEQKEIPFEVCVATGYGAEILENAGIRCPVHIGRLDASGMEELMRSRSIRIVIDATHPYAREASANIHEASNKAGVPYYRLLRETPEHEDSHLIRVKSIEEAANYLNAHGGKALITTGSKELEKYTVVRDYQERLYVRVLPCLASIEECGKLGFSGEHLIAMQGPFSEEMNTSILRMCKADYLVTKESGASGGVPEKINAAKAVGAAVLLVERPPEERGYSMEELLRIIDPSIEAEKSKASADSENSSFASERETGPSLSVGQAVNTTGGKSSSPLPCLVAIVGIGMGAPEGMTVEAQQAIRSAELLMGAERMLESARSIPGLMSDGKKRNFAAVYQAEKILQCLSDHPEVRRAAVLVSGDIGFYSAADSLVDALKGYELRFCCGISTLSYLCSALAVPWDDVCSISLHGRKANLIGAVRTHKKVFVLAGGRNCFDEICERLCTYGLGDVKLSVGWHLSYPDEQILSGTPASLRGKVQEGLIAVLVENDEAEKRLNIGIPDEVFERGQVPMTKSEIRAICLSRLGLMEDSIAYDIGSGSGSVSIEMALAADQGMVYAIEQKKEALALIARNQLKFGTENLSIVEGSAPEALADLPAPTHAFIGGSDGRLRDILQILLEKNSGIRIVMTAVTLETLAEATAALKELPLKDVEIVCASISRAKELGHYHLMQGLNPVYIISCSGDESSF